MAPKKTKSAPNNEAGPILACLDLITVLRYILPSLCPRQRAGLQVWWKKRERHTHRYRRCDRKERRKEMPGLGIVTRVLGSKDTSWNESETCLTAPHPQEPGTGQRRIHGEERA